MLVPEYGEDDNGQSMVPSTAITTASTTRTSAKRPLPPKDFVFVSLTPNVKSLDADYYSPDRSDDKRTMLRYYTQVLADILTTTETNNSFLSVFLPMAMDSLSLQKALMAWSSAHISSYLKSYMVRALEHRSQALQSSAGALARCSHSSSQADIEVMLATGLVLCAMDIVLGDTESWFQHLVGARDIILFACTFNSNGVVLRGPQCFRGSDSQWLLRNFAYHDIIGSLTTLEPPLIQGSYWSSGDGSIVDSYWGIGTEVLVMLSEVCALNPSEVTEEDEHEDEAEELSQQQQEREQLAHDAPLPSISASSFWKDSVRLEAKLQRWQCTNFSNLSLVKLVQAQRSTALIVLHRKQRIYCYNNPAQARRLPVITAKVAAAVQSSVYHIRRLNLDSRAAGGLLCPLFIAGGDAMESADFEFLRGSLQKMFDRRGFGNIARAIDVLDELWRLRLNGFHGPAGRPVDWIDVLERRGWRLMLS
ncbi:hypothetical protein BP5796_02931 [Coleophoma crateriformis]|uniref:Uncharacterized protein n=1 Tax=Coleophoma crateriformis TaxID=565419 RepID=A0A3D8SLP2_9HELO|nr:hypothetical protein BP5796_02931 [Coleophoma crateriformis]